MQRSENELLIMHATTDLISVGASAIKNLSIAKKCREIVFICKKYSELEKIAEVLQSQGTAQVSCLIL